MNEIEKMLAEEKHRLETVETPPELANRLKTALGNAERPKKTRPVWLSLATIAALLFILIGYNFNAVAYYGKKLIGHDEVMTETLKQLNEKGLGQIIDKTFSLDNGIKFTVDAVVTDENRLLLFYTIKDPKIVNNTDYEALLSPGKITGVFTDSNFESGVEILKEDKGVSKGSWEFEAVSPFSKKLTLHLDQTVSDGHTKALELTIPYDPSQALQTQHKLRINKSVEVDQGAIKFQSLIATPTETVIKGKLKVDNFDRVTSSLFGIELIVNGKSLEKLGGSSGTSLAGGTEFEIEFDALPEKIDSLTINVHRFAGYKKLNKKIDLIHPKDATFNIGGKSLWIENVMTNNERTEITISTDYDILLDEVSIKGSKGRTPLETITGQTDIKDHGRNLKKRTLLFPTGNPPTHLEIGGMHYMKTYNKAVEIPVK